MSRKLKIAILISLDSFLIFLAYLFSYLILEPYVTISWRLYFFSVLLYISLYLIFGIIFNVFTQINRYTSLKELIFISFSIFFSSGVELIYFFVFGDSVSRRFIVLGFLLIIFFISASRIIWRIIIEYMQLHKTYVRKLNKTIVVGAGDGGRILLESIRQSKTNENIDVIGLVDDDQNKYKTWLVGKQVIGTVDDLPRIISELSVDMVTIAIPSLHPKEYERILDLVRSKGVKVTMFPSIEEIASGAINVSKIREVDVVDLLGREEVKLSQDNISAQIANKTVLVTGAGGSIGSEICRQIMRFSPKQLLLLGHGENSIYQIEKELRKNFSNSFVEIKPIIADIQDRSRIFDIMKYFTPDVVYHAAAHKHVPLMEYNPSEAIKNNIFGTKNVAEASKENGVKSFVMISTDKAVNPPNVMGATKRVAEMIVTGLNELGKTKFSAVRFGNVLGSRGSVIPLFKEQIKNGGPVTVTDFRMTRYFMTIPEASRLVIQSSSLAEGGEIFILDMGEPVKIVDLARKIIKLSGFSEDDIGIVETGIRPGEKLYEELLVSKEKSNRKVYDKIFVGNVNGFTYEEAVSFSENLSNHYSDSRYLTEQIIRFANESIK